MAAFEKRRQNYLEQGIHGQAKLTSVLPAREVKSLPGKYGINMFLEINSCKFRNMAQLEKTNSFLEILINVYYFRNNFSHF